MAKPGTPTYWCRDCEQNVHVARVRMSREQIAARHKTTGKPPVLLPQWARYVLVQGTCGHSGYIVTTVQNVEAMRSQAAGSRGLALEARSA